jgi:hypothetical protein
MARIAFVLVVALIPTLGAAGIPTDRTASLQELAVRIKLALDGVRAGNTPDSAQLAQFDRALANLRATAGDNAATGAFTTKLAAVERLRSNLKHASTQAIVAPHRRQADVQSVTDRHGATCETALGITESQPVAAVLSRAGSRRDSVWFRFDPPAERRYGFRTESSGADPKLEIVGDCSESATVEAANDDDLGLDAAVVARANRRHPIFMHVTNSWQGGLVSVAAASTGTISGKLTDAATGQPLSAAIVTAFSSAGGYWSSVGSFLSGDFSIDVYPGTYYVMAQDDQHAAILYPGVVCSYPSPYYSDSNCNVSQGQVLPVSAGSNIQSINFSLPAGHKIEGLVRDTSNQPLIGFVHIYSAAGVSLDTKSTDAYGRYSFAPLPPANYKVSADASGYGQQMFDHVDCSSAPGNPCDLSTADAIAVDASNVANVNFNLTPESTIRGNVYGSGGQPVPNYNVFVVDSFGNTVGQNYYWYNNPYTIGPLGAGTYYVYVKADGYYSQLFDGIDCGSNCIASIPEATPISIAGPDQAVQADFHLTPLPLVHGNVKDSVTGLPLAGVVVLAGTSPPASFSPDASAATDSGGNYTLPPLLPGTYYLWAQSGDHIDQVYSGIPCERLTDYFAQPCDVVGATLLTVASGEQPPAFDFVLQPSSSISGRAITDAGPGSELAAHLTVTAYDGSGVVVASTATDNAGNYLMTDLPARTYFVYATPSYEQFVPQLWQGIDCPDGCPPVTGTPIPLAANSVADDIDFKLVLRHAFVGRITDPDNAPLGGVLVDLFNADNGGYFGTGVTDAQGYYAATPVYVGASAYFIATDSGRAYVDQVYSGVSCPNGSVYVGLCSLLNATAVGLSYFNTQPVIINFTLKPNDTVFTDGFEAF